MLRSIEHWQSKIERLQSKIEAVRGQCEHEKQIGKVRFGSQAEVRCAKCGKLLSCVLGCEVKEYMEQKYPKIEWEG